MTDNDSNTLGALAVFAALLAWLLWPKRATGATTTVRDVGTRPPIVLWPGTIFETTVEGYEEELPTEDAATISYGAGRR